MSDALWLGMVIGVGVVVWFLMALGARMGPAETVEQEREAAKAWRRDVPISRQSSRLEP